MSWEALSALATLISAGIVAVAAVAAVLQIRHLRTGNQLQTILRIYDRFNDSEMVAARAYCLNELPAILAKRAHGPSNDTVDPRVTFVGNFFNEIGALVVDGLLDEKLVWPLVPNAARLWKNFLPMAREFRLHRQDPVWADFEYLATLQEQLTRDKFIARFPGWFRSRLSAEPPNVATPTSTRDDGLPELMP